ncbi:MAG: MBL fold metallo-hydrolase, partial [Acidobacteria bacterium]|nr:MBL fold metallo-hydrolase [Acidobacteriota bacterium]
AGTGIRRLGQELMRSGLKDRKINLFLTHFHWDHIHGLPFFAPIFENVPISFFTGGSGHTSESVLAGQMKSPYFPVDFKAAGSKCDFFDMDGSPFRSGPCTVQAFPVHHPQGAFGFRVEAFGSSLAYVPDREPGDPKLDRILCQSVEGVDILIHDAQYTPEEYELYRGWGHSTWLQAAQVAADCRVKQLVLFHHDPEHDDAAVERIQSEARQHFPNTCAAVEGWVATFKP